MNENELYMNANELLKFIYKHNPQLPENRLLVIGNNTDDFAIYDNYDLEYSPGIIFKDNCWFAHSNALRFSSPINYDTVLTICKDFLGEGAETAHNIVSVYMNMFNNITNNSNTRNNCTQ